MLDDYQSGRSTIGLTSTPPVNTLLSGALVIVSGCLASSSVSEASVTEAQPNERATMDNRAMVDLSDFMVVGCFI